MPSIQHCCLARGTLDSPHPALVMWHLRAAGAGILLSEGLKVVDQGPLRWPWEVGVEEVEFGVDDCLGWF